MRILFILISTCMLYSVWSQTYHLDVQGHSKIRGNLDIAHMVDSTSIYIGPGINNNTIQNLLYNTFLGKSAGANNSDGYNNTLVGAYSGFENTSGRLNSFYGYNSGYRNDDGYANCYFGYESGFTNQSGFGNCLFGYRSGAGNNGDYNAFFGHSTGLNSVGDDNSFFGASAGAENGNGSENSYFGNRAGRINRNGTRNSFFGANSSINSGNDSLDRAIAIGYFSRVDCHNCAVIGGIGENAVKLGVGVDSPSVVLSLLETGATNPVGITQNQVGGPSTMELTTSDDAGLQATRLMLRGDSDNPDIQFLRGARGAENLSVLIKGTNGYLGVNTNNPLRNLDVNGDARIQNSLGIGTNMISAPLTVLRSGELKSDFITLSNSQSVFHRFYYNNDVQGASLGFDTANNLAKFVHGGGFAASTKGIAINSTGQVGINTELPAAKLDVNGTLRVQNPTSDPGIPLYISPLGILSTSASDHRLKKQVETLSHGLEKILALRGVTYYWQDPEYPNAEIGLIAQEVEEVLPEVVFTNSSTGYKGIKYAEITAVLVEAIKEQQKLIEIQQNELEALKKQSQVVESLQSEIDALKQLIIGRMN